MNSKFAKEHPKFAKVVMYASIAVQITASLVTLRLASAGAGVSKIANAADDAARLGTASKQAASTAMMMAEAESGAQMADDLVNGAKSASQTLDKTKQVGDAAEANKELSRLEKMTKYMNTGTAYGSVGTNTAKTISTVDLAVTTAKSERLDADVDDTDKWMSFYRKKMDEMIEELKDELSAVQSAVFNASKASSTLNKSAMKVTSHIGANPRGAI
ncbi:MAG: type III secretion system translocon subunit SctE, partial [Pseudomonadota bacterium]